MFRAAAYPAGVRMRNRPCRNRTNRVLGSDIGLDSNPRNLGAIQSRRVGRSPPPPPPPPRAPPAVLPAASAQNAVRSGQRSAVSEQRLEVFDAVGTVTLRRGGEFSVTATA